MAMISMLSGGPNRERKAIRERGANRERYVFTWGEKRALSKLSGKEKKAYVRELKRKYAALNKRVG
jgi:hypothetical protein